MYPHKIKQIILLMSLIILLSACGHPIPTASIELLQQKKAILLLTSPSIDKSLEAQITHTLNTWKQSEFIAYEWIQQVNVIDDLLVKKMNNNAYSYIVVLGKDLTPTALKSATQTKNKRWIILSDANRAESIPSSVPDDVAMYQLNAGDVANKWSKWNKQQQQQQQQQIIANNVFHSSVDAATYQVIPMSNIPIIDLNNSGTAILQWDAILAEQLKVIQLNSFDPGIHYYNDQQIRINPS
ncbi:MAG: hypothetical protein WD469_13500 [Paenibacillaceae bacterium]